MGQYFYVSVGVSGSRPGDGERQPADPVVRKEHGERTMHRLAEEGSCIQHPAGHLEPKERRAVGER